MTNAFNPTLGWGKTTVGTLANKTTSFSRCKWVLAQIKREDAHEKMPAYSRIFWRWILMALLGLLPERRISPNCFSFLLNCQKEGHCWLFDVSLNLASQKNRAYTWLLLVENSFELWTLEHGSSHAKPHLLNQKCSRNTDIKRSWRERALRDIAGAWHRFTRWRDTGANLHWLALNYHHHYILLRLLIPKN